MAEREESVYKAKLAEQAERYDGMCLSDMVDVGQSSRGSPYSVWSKRIATVVCLSDIGVG